MPKEIKQRTFYISPELLSKLQTIAEMEHRSFNAQAIWIFEKFIKMYEVSQKSGKSLDGSIDKVLEELED